MTLKNTPLESKLIERMKRDLQNLPFTWFFKSQERGRRGIPDFIACINGRFYAFEAKRSGEKPTPLQAYTLKNISSAKGVSLAVTPESWESQYQMIKENVCHE